MSIKAHLYLLSEDSWRQFSLRANLVSKSIDCSLTVKSDAAIQLLPPINSKVEGLSSAEAKSQASFLSKAARQKFKYKWSGNLLYDLLEFLKVSKNIDLMEQTLVQQDTQDEWYVLNTLTKRKYAHQLLPENFTETSLKDAHAKILRTNQASNLKEICEERGLSDQQTKYFLDNMTPFQEVPEAGMAFLDGIKLLQECFANIDEYSVVAINIS